MDVVTLASQPWGLIFTAIAAWGAGAAMTVILTRESLRDAECRRIFEAVAAMIDAARLLRGAPTEQWREVRFRDAQLEVQRAVNVRHTPSRALTPFSRPCRTQRPSRIQTRPYPTRSERDGGFLPSLGRRNTGAGICVPRTDS